MPTQPRPWRRLFRHVTRDRARTSGLGIAVALIVLLLAGPDGPVGQVALVAIGTLVSLALLPDEPQRLWNVEARALAETIPADKLEEAGRELTRAIALQQSEVVPEPLMSGLWSAQFEDLSAAAKNPASVVRNLSYEVRVDRVASRGQGALDVPMVSVRSDLGGERHVPDVPEIFVSFCSTLDALEAEFSTPGCVLRELVPPLALEPPARWAERLSGSVVTMTLGGQELTFLRHDVQRLGLVDSYVTRFVFASRPSADRYTSCRVHTEFQTVDTGIFDVKFSSYYAVGHTNVVFELRDADVQLEFSEFMSRSGRPVTESPSISPNGQRVQISTHDNAVLPPGSGVMFRWTAGVPQLLLPPRSHMVPGHEGAPLPESVSLPTRRRPVEPETHEQPLVPVTRVATLDAYATLGILQPRQLQVRRDVLDRLRRADDALPEGFSLLVLDAWRSLDVQRQLVAHYPSAATDDQYIADPDSQHMRPPHVTGGAVDLTLSWRDRPLALGTDFDSFDVAAHLTAFEQIDGTTRRLRRLLAQVLLDAGFAPYPYEWWHWSFGDDVWAEHRQASRALYDVVAG